MIIERLPETTVSNPSTMEDIVDRLNKLIDAHNTIEEVAAECF